jgi:prevent-host-death family protein
MSEWPADRRPLVRFLRLTGPSRAAIAGNAVELPEPLRNELTMSIDREEQHALHRAVVRNEATAPAKVAEALLDALVARLSIRLAANRRRCSARAGGRQPCESPARTAPLRPAAAFPPPPGAQAIARLYEAEERPGEPRPSGSQNLPVGLVGTMLSLATLARTSYAFAMTQFGMHEAKTKLSQLVERAESGEDIIIARNGKPAVRLVPARTAASLASVRGAWRGRVSMTEDFDVLPDDLAEAFGAK